MNKQKLIVIKTWTTVDTIYAPEGIRGEKLKEWCKYNVSESAQIADSKPQWSGTEVEYDGGELLWETSP